MGVSLVGAGPHDMGLLTLKGYDKIKNADVIIYDKLANPAILSYANGEKIYVGKSGGDHTLPQDQINALILEYALAGKEVVRLKGGDPYLFGRGAEELDFLNQQNIDYEVIPGITSAISVPAYAGIPVTHRDYASSLHIITGHYKEGKVMEMDFDALVRLKGTLVFLMSIGSLKYILNGLLNAGMDKDMSAAIIENGTTYKQREIVATIGTIYHKAKEENIKPPAIFVIGQVCKLSEKYHWFSKKKLSHVKAIVCGHQHSSDKLTHSLYKHGCDVLSYPCIETAPIKIDQQWNFSSYDWIIFTSQKGVRYFFASLKAGNLDIRTLSEMKFAAIGPETAKALREYGIFADFIPSEFHSEAMGNELLDQNIKKALIVKGSSGSDHIKNILAENHIPLDEILIYETVPVKQEKISLTGVSYITFTSASSVYGFMENNRDGCIDDITAICIGHLTAEAAKEFGFKTAVPAEASTNAMINMILEMEEYDA